MKILSRKDELVLLAVWRLQDNAYGVPILKHIIKNADTDWSLGTIYDTLDRLADWDYVTSYQSDPTPERGGKSKRYFKITEEGIKALKHMKKVQESMWLGLSAGENNLKI